MDRSAKQAGSRSDEHQVPAETDDQDALAVLAEQRRPGRAQYGSPELVSLLRGRDLVQEQGAVPDLLKGEDPYRFRLLYGLGIIFVTSVLLWAFIISVGGTLAAIWRLPT